MCPKFLGLALVFVCVMFLEGCGAATPDAKPAATAKAKKGKTKKKVAAKPKTPEVKPEVAAADEKPEAAAPESTPTPTPAAPDTTTPPDTPPSETPAAPPASAPKTTAPPVEPLAIEYAEIASVPVMQNGFRELEFSKDDSTLLLASLGPIQRWRVPKLDDHNTYQSNSESVSFSSDDKLLAVSGDPGSGLAQILNAKNGKVVKAFKNDKANLKTTRISPDGKTLSISEGHSEMGKSAIHLWDVATRKKKSSITLEGDRWAKNVAFSPDSKSLAFPDQNGGEIRIWDVEAGKEDWRYPVPAAPWGGHLNGALRWCADGKLAGVALDGSYHLMDVANKKIERTQFPRGEANGWCAALSPDGRIVAIVVLSDNQRIILLDAWAGKALKALEGHSRQIECLAFSSDGKYLASINAAEDIQLKLWKATAKTGGSESK